MALPGRVDSPSSAGSLDLLRDGAHLIVEPADVLNILRQDARHFFYGTHEAKTSNPARESSHAPTPSPTRTPPKREALPEPEGVLGDIYRAITEPMSADALSEALDIDPGLLRSQLTMLEIQGLIRREGSRFARVR
jgi:predicted Rossmann fold nucleotide-binding protein DprA/Smf involved in DNA uptake